MSGMPTGTGKLAWMYEMSKPVHHLEECSKAFGGDEEGYGQRRICNECNFLYPNFEMTKTSGSLHPPVEARHIVTGPFNSTDVGEKKNSSYQQNY